MFRSKRAIATAIAAFGLMAATDIPTDFQAIPTSDAAVFDTSALDVPDDAGLASLPSIGDAAESDLPLPALVSNIADLGEVELDEEMRCLASAVYNEARGESVEGQLAVAQVVLNRAADPRWPSTICGVVYQRYQFSFTFDNQPDFPNPQKPLWKQAEAVAIVAATENWHDLTGDAVYYHATYVSPRWRTAFTQTANIGRHIFYR